MQYLLDHLEKLVAFKAVAEAGSFHKAADQIRISQPSLSASIGTLESAVSARLFHRSHKGVTLTTEGVLLLEFTRRLVAESKDIEIKLSQPEQKIVGRLRVGLYESLAIYFWPDFIKSFQKLYPGIRFQLSTGRSSILQEKLIRKDVDVVLSIEAREHKQYVTKTLHSDSFGFYASTKVAKALGSSSKKRAPSLVDLPMILFPGALGTDSDVIQAQVEKLGLKGDTFYEVDSFEVAKEFAMSDIGVAFLPNRVAQKYCKARRLQKLKTASLKTDSFSEHRICLSYSRELLTSPLLKCLDEALVEHSKNLEPLP